MSQILLHEISPEQFKELFLEAFKETLGKTSDKLGMSINVKTLKSEDEQITNKENFLTRKQAAKSLQISLPTLHQYTKDSLIPSFRIGYKVRYKESDIEKALTERNYGRRVSL
jgi:excisionase family DNA binding protein